MTYDATPKSTSRNMQKQTSCAFHHSGSFAYTPYESMLGPCGHPSFRWSTSLGTCPSSVNLQLSTPFRSLLALSPHFVHKRFVHSIPIDFWPLQEPKAFSLIFCWHISFFCSSCSKHTIHVSCLPCSFPFVHKSTPFLSASTKIHHHRFLSVTNCSQRVIFPLFFFGSVCLHMLHIESDILTTHFSYFSQVFIHTVVFGPLHFLSVLGGSFGRPCCLCELWQVHTTLAKTPRRVSFPFL